MAEILVEFVPDFSKLETGVDELVKNGKISKEMAALFTDASKSIDQFAAKFAKLGTPIQNALKPAIDQAKKSLKDLSTSGIKDFGELKKRVDGITNSFTDGFGDGVKEALAEAGISLEEFENALKQTDETGKSLKAQLREMNEQLAVMKLNGQDNTQQYAELSAKAAQYRDTLQDVNEQINKQASDTRKLDTAIEFVTGLASAFSILQGIQALAGKDNEELQKTLVKVQSAMSILIGLQQLQNILKKESNLIQAVENVQKKIGVISTNLETAAQSKNIIVKNAAVVAQKALNAVMSANPAILLIAAFTALAGALVLFSGDTKDAREEVEDFNDELERTNTIIDRSLEKIKTEGELRVAELKAQGKTQDEIAKENASTIAKQADIIAENIRKRNQEISDALIKMNESQRTTIRRLGITQEEFNKITTEGVNNVDDALALLNKVKAVKTSDAWAGFNEKARANNDLIENMLANLLDLAKQQETQGTEQLKTGFEEDERRREEAEKKRKEAEDKAKQDREKRLKEEADARRRELEDVLAIAKAKLLVTKEGTVGELEAKKEVASAQLSLDFNALEGQKDTFNKRRLLLQTFFKEQKELTEQFNETSRKQVVEDQITNIKNQLNSLSISNEEKTRLTIEQLQIEKDEELRLVVNNESKRKEIISRFEKEIFEIRKKSLQESQNEELEDIRRNLVQRKAILEADVSNDDLGVDKRKAALQELTRFEEEEFTKRRLNNQAQLKLAGINNEEALKEFAKNAKDIDNDQFASRKKNEEKYTDIVESESEKRLRRLKKIVSEIADLANAVIDAFRAFTDTMNANEDARVQSQRDSLQRLRELNGITEKEFIAKSRVIDRLERQTKQKQAEREKAIALFEALVNGAAAIVKAAPDPFAIVATSILVTAQVAAIVARPVPKFGKGTEKAPKGLAQVGETGTEIIETEKGYYIAEHPQIVWFKGGEKVFNPKDTKEIFTYNDTKTRNEKTFTKSLKEKSFYINKDKETYTTNFELIRSESLQIPQANMMIVNNSNGVSHETKFDIDKMAKKIGQEIAKHPRVINNIDADGYSLYIQEGLNKSKYLNRRFTSND